MKASDLLALGMGIMAPAATICSTATPMSWKSR